MKKNFIAIIITFYSSFALAQNQQSKIDAVNIFENLTHIKPIRCIVGEFNNKQVIMCLAEKSGSQKERITDPDIVFYKLSVFANIWRIETQQPVFKEQYKYCQFLGQLEIATIDTMPYLYFLYSLADQGSAAGNIETLKFSLFSLNDYKLLSLDDEGYANYDDKTGNFQYIKDGDFLNIDSIKSQPTFLNFLEEKARKSVFIYRPTKKDLDINDPINFDQKWTLDNPNVINTMDNADKLKPYNDQLKITYYQKNLFFDNKGDSRAENSTYKFISYFRGPIIGFNKQKKKYFPIWVQHCNTGCDKEISFANPTTLKIVYSESNNQTVLVNLKTMTYSVLNKPIVKPSQLPNLNLNYFETIGQPIFLYKSESYIRNALGKAKGWHYDGTLSNDFKLNILTFSHTYEPTNAYEFQASYNFWIDDNKLCKHCFVTFPSFYFRYMLSRLKGFVVIDNNHLLSKDRKIGISVSINNGVCEMEFYANN